MILILITISWVFYKFSTRSFNISCSFWNLFSLRRQILLSRFALDRLGLTIFPVALTPQMYKRVCPSSHTSGISDFRCFWGDISGSHDLTLVRRQLPTSLVLRQSNMQCCKVPTDWVGQSLQNSEEFGSILFSLCSVGRIWWRSFHRNVVTSYPSPLNLALLQLVSQSVSGEESSALHFLYTLGLSA